MEEDLYSSGCGLGDFINEPCGFMAGIRNSKAERYKNEADEASLQEIRQALTSRRLRTFEERYLDPSSDQYYQACWAERVKKICPLKIIRLDACIRVMNECKSKTAFFVSFNEFARLIYGKKQKQWILGKRYDPGKFDCLLNKTAR